MLPSKSILSLLLTPTTSFENPGKPTLTTLLKLVSNSLLHPVLVEFLLEEAQVPGLTRLVVRGLLDDDKTVRSLGAGLAWSVVGRVRALVSDGEGKEEWEVEIASAVVEALGREVESADVGMSHRFSPLTLRVLTRIPLALALVFAHQSIVFQPLSDCCC